MRIQSDEKSLKQLFTANEVYTVPEYQRNYAWKSEQISAFLEDVELLTQPNASEHFFGPLVVLNTDHGELSLIDGQQRLTTVIMLLCILRDHAENLEDDVFVIETSRISITQKITDLLKSNDLINDRYVANYKIKRLFKDYVLRSTNDPARKRFSLQAKTMTAEEKRATRELRSAYTAIDKETRKWIGSVSEEEQRERLYRIVTSIEARFRVLEIRMFSEDDAYVFFETLNERGLRLTPSDLLKNYTLRMARNAEDDSVADVLDTWDSTVEQLGDFPFTKFLRHYLLAVQSKPVQSKTIFRTFTDLIDKYGENGAVENLTNLRRAAELYAMILPGGQTGSDELDAIAQRLNSFSETHRVFLLAALLGDFSIEATVDAFRAVEALAFRWIVTGGNAQELEAEYRKAATSLVESEDASLRRVTGELLGKLPKDEAVAAALTHEPAKIDLQWYVLRKISAAQTGDQSIWTAPGLVVEYVAPQRPVKDSGWFSKVAPAAPTDPNAPSYEEFVSKWGNLTLLTNALDSKIQNASWSTKKSGDPLNEKEGLKISSLPITVDVTRCDDWNAQTIDDRTEWIANSMVELSSSQNALDPKTRVPAFAGE